MANEMDIMNALEDTITSILGASSIDSSLYPYSVFKGWPERNQIKNAHQESPPRTLISVYPPQGLIQNISKYSLVPFKCDSNPIPINLFVGMSGNTEQEIKINQGAGIDIIFGFTSGDSELSIGENIVIIFKRYQQGNVDPDNGQSAKDLVIFYTIQSGDTLVDVIDNLILSFTSINTPDVLIPNITLSNVSNTTLHIDYADNSGVYINQDIIIRIGSGSATQKWFREVGRYIQLFWINIWAASPTLRNLFSSNLEAAFGLLGGDSRLLLADGSKVIVLLNSGFISDKEQKENNWRKTIVISAEYQILQEVKVTEIIAVINEVNIDKPLTPFPFPEDYNQKYGGPVEYKVGVYPLIDKTSREILDQLTVHADKQ